MTDRPPARQVLGVPVPMRDGVRLSTDLYFPRAGPDGGPYPTLLFRTPYDNEAPRYMAPVRRFTEAGYAAALQDVRGRYDSEGEFRPYVCEGRDGFDTIEWLAHQAWSTGRIGTWGASYAGGVQWAAARERPPHLDTMVSTAAVGRWFEELPYMNGALMLRHVQWAHLMSARTNQEGSLVNWADVLWHLPLRTLPDRIRRDLPLWQEWLDHPTLDEHWRALRLDDDFRNIDLPVLHITGWYDADQEGALFYYAGMRGRSSAAERQSLVIGPWDHVGTIENRDHIERVSFGASAVLDVAQLHIAWFDGWLKPEGSHRDVPGSVRFFLTGANRWTAAPSWPPPDASEMTLYLEGGDGRRGALRDSVPAPSSAHYRYDPADPLMLEPDIARHSLTTPGTPIPDPPMDLSHLEQRADVLVYTSAELDRPLTVTGRPRLVLYASSDAPDTDWCAWITDVGPEGPIFLTFGILRARFREGLDRERLMSPGTTYRFEIPLREIGHVFEPGHRIRVLVSSSFFPAYDRNPNTGHPIGADAEIHVAENTVCHGDAHASHLLLARWEDATAARA